MLQIPDLHLLFLSGAYPFSLKVHRPAWRENYPLLDANESLLVFIYLVDATLMLRNALISRFVFISFTTYPSQRFRLFLYLLHLKKKKVAPTIPSSFGPECENA